MTTTSIKLHLLFPLIWLRDPLWQKVHNTHLNEIKMFIHVCLVCNFANMLATANWITVTILDNNKIPCTSSVRIRLQRVLFSMYGATVGLIHRCWLSQQLWDFLGLNLEENFFWIFSTNFQIRNKTHQNTDIKLEWKKQTCTDIIQLLAADGDVIFV